jgi:hypothetical protein
MLLRLDSTVKPTLSKLLTMIQNRLPQPNEGRSPDFPPRLEN